MAFFNSAVTVLQTLVLALGAAAFWTFWINYGILKLKGNGIKHNSKKSVEINRSCGL